VANGTGRMKKLDHLRSREDAQLASMQLTSLQPETR
jgi:hypothetical protein